MKDALEIMKEMEDTDGVFIDRLELGTILEVQTQNTLYTIVTCEDKKEKNILIQGGGYYSKVTDAILQGSSFGGSMLRIKYIGISMCMELWSEPSGPIMTTSVTGIKLIAPDGSWEYTLGEEETT
tara:strand:- start:129 stop:503 length:375 start_codon:yes stop_codon:yes gene_type:complete